MGSKIITRNIFIFIKIIFTKLKMNKIIIKYFENLKNSFEKVSISFNEKILCNSKQQKINNKIQFDVVFRIEDNILFMGLISESREIDNRFINSCHEKHKSNSKNVYLFFPLIDEIWDLKRLEEINKPFFDSDELVIKVKEKYPITKTKNDLIHDLEGKLNSQQDGFNSQLEKLKETYSKEVLDFESEIKLKNSILKSAREEKVEFKNLFKMIENDILERLKLKLKKIDFINLSKKIELKPIITDKEIATPNGSYKEIISISNDSTELFFTIYKNEVHCRIKKYTYHSQGPLGIGASIYNSSLYYILDESSKRFVKEEEIDFDIWVSKNIIDD